MLYFINLGTFKVDFIIGVKELADDKTGPILSHVFVDIATHDDLYVEIQSGSTVKVFKLNIMKDLPGYIPRRLLERENMLTFY